MTRPFPRLPTADARPDGELLAAFASFHDDGAFAELVRRHARLVWAACRRYLPDPLDAEDAFQASFLVLVRRANRLTRHPTVGPWLCRVAAYTARNLRRKNARRLARVRPFPADVPHPPPVPVPDLDSALLSLPEKYRTPLVLCHLDGLTRREAAARLGCPEGTLSALVSRGLAKLRTKLSRDPLTLAAATLPAGLTAATARAAVAFRLAELPSGTVSHLIEGAIRMFWVKKATAAGLAGALMLAAGFGLGVGVRHAPATAADDPPGKRTVPPSADDHKARLDAARAAEARARIELEKAKDRMEAARRGVEVAEVAMKQAEAERWARATPARLEVIVNGAPDRQPFAVVEPNADGDAELTTHAATAAGLRRHLARVAADSKGPKTILVSAAKLAAWERLREAMDAVKTAGFAGLRLKLHPDSNVRELTGKVIEAKPGTATMTAEGLEIGFALKSAAGVRSVVTNSYGQTVAVTVRVGQEATVNLREAAELIAGPERDKRIDYRYNRGESKIVIVGRSPGTDDLRIRHAGVTQTTIAVTVEAAEAPPAVEVPRAVKLVVGGSKDVTLPGPAKSIRATSARVTVAVTEDGKAVRLTGMSAGGAEVYVVPADGGPERVIEVTVE